MSLKDYACWRLRKGIPYLWHDLTVPSFTVSPGPNLDHWKGCCTQTSILSQSLNWFGRQKNDWKPIQYNYIYFKWEEDWEYFARIVAQTADTWGNRNKYKLERCSHQGWNRGIAVYRLFNYNNNIVATQYKWRKKKNSRLKTADTQKG